MRLGIIQGAFRSLSFSKARVPALKVRIPAPSPIKLLSNSVWDVAPIQIPVRGYARKVVRKRPAVKVDVEEPTRTEQQNASLMQQEELQRQQEQQQYYEQEEVETYSAITSEVRTHLTKVYGLMTAGFGAMFGGAILGGMAPGLALFGTIGSFVGVLALVFTDPSKVALRQNLLLGVGAMLGMGIGPLLAATAPGIVAAAAFGTMAIFGGFTIAALRAKRRQMLMLGGPLLGGLLLIFGAGLASLLLPMFGVASPALLGALYNINLYGGLAIFSLFISYDTQQMIESYHEGNRDHVTPALNMMLNLFNIFVRLLQIFRGSD